MRISQENENSPRSKDCESPQTPGQKTPHNCVKYTFPKNARVRTRRHYQRLYSQGKKFFGELIGVDLIFGQSPRPRLGITVSKKHGKAHERNLFKRLVREAFRHSAPFLPSNMEINVFPKVPIEKMHKSGIEADLLFFAKK
jgi:ribonuclease P protein component